MTKKVLFGKEARDKILTGVKKITDAVKVTMGAQGKCVLIGEAVYGNDGMIPLPTIITKDGFNTTKHFSLEDPLENRGALIIKEAAAKTVEMAGDATTCTCVLAEALITEGMKLIDEGANSQELKRGMDIGVENVVRELKKISIPIDSNEKIFQIATVSANNDTQIGKLISDAFEKIGYEGVVDIEQAKGVETEIKIADGFKFSRGWVSPFFVNNKEKQICEFEDPLILLYDKRITHHTQIQKALEITMQQGKPLLIICEEVDEEGLAFLAMNNIQGRIRCCVVKAPEFGELQREQMEDISILTGATFISDRKGLDIKQMQLKQFGSAKKVIVSREETIIRDANCDITALENLLNELRMNLTQAKNEFEKSLIEKRIARLNGSIAVIQVGAVTETEMKEKLDRFDDAVRSVKSAISEGYVAGGGTAFVRISNTLNQKGIKDIERGEQLVYSILSAPIKQMAENAGKDSESILKSVQAETGNFGYNILTEKIEDMVEVGVIDSAKALRCALVNAASVAGMALITECLIETTF